MSYQIKTPSVRKKVPLQVKFYLSMFLATQKKGVHRVSPSRMNRMDCTNTYTSRIQHCVTVEYTMARVGPGEFPICRNRFYAVGMPVNSREHGRVLMFVVKVAVIEPA